MQWASCSRSMAIGGIGLMAALTTAVLGEPANAQMQVQQMQAPPASGFNALDPQWSLGNPFMGFSAGSSLTASTSQQSFTTRLGSGTVGWFSESNSGSAATSSNLFGPMLASPNTQRENWFANLGNPAWSTVLGSYKSDLSTTALGGLYTTADFGMTSMKANPSGFSGLPNFATGNDVTGFSARAGVGVQLTPNVSIEGSVGITQAPTLR